MRKNESIISIVFVLVIIILAKRGSLQPIFDFLQWLFFIKQGPAYYSLIEEIIIRIVVFILSYSLVWILFSYLDWFNSTAMRITYFIISTLLSFALCGLVMVFERYLTVILIVAGCLLLIMVISFTLFKALRKNDKNNSQQRRE